MKKIYINSAQAQSVNTMHTDLFDLKHSKSSKKDFIHLYPFNEYPFSHRLVTKGPEWTQNWGAKTNFEHKNKKQTLTKTSKMVEYII